MRDPPAAEGITSAETDHPVVQCAAIAAHRIARNLFDGIAGYSAITGIAGLVDS